MKRKPGGKDRDDLPRTHAPPQVERRDRLLNVSRLRLRASRPPAAREPYKVLALGAVDSGYSATGDSKEAVHDRCHVAGALRSTVEMSDKSNPPRLSTSPPGRMKFTTRYDWPALLLAMRSSRSNAARALSSMVAIHTAARSHSKVGPIARTASIEPIGGKPVAITVRLDRGILSRELAGLYVDFWLTFGRDCRKMRAMPLEESTRVRHPAPPIPVAPRRQLRDQGRHPPRDLAINQLELALTLPPNLLHAVTERQAIRGRGHVALPGCHPMKSDGPP